MSAPVWGCPWHGLLKLKITSFVGANIVQQGLELADGSERVWPARVGPQRADVAHYGTSFLQRTPVATPDPETPESMAAEGMQWLDYALVGGGGSTEVHGRRLGDRGWIYWDAEAGIPWKLNLAVTPEGADLINYASVTLTLSAVPSGLALPADVPSITVQAAIGQSSPALPGWPFAPENLRYAVVDAVPDGSKVIIGVFFYNNWRYRDDINADAYNDVSALGYWLLDLSGSPLSEAGVDLQLTELANRADCLGTHSFTPLPLVTYQDPRYDLRMETIDDRTREYTAEYKERAEEDRLGTSTEIIADKVVGYWFDAEGAALPVRLSYEFTHSRTIDTAHQIIEPGPIVVVDNLQVGGTLLAETEWWRDTLYTVTAKLEWAEHTLEYEAAWEQHQYRKTHYQPAEGQIGVTWTTVVVEDVNESSGSAPDGMEPRMLWPMLVYDSTPLQDETYTARITFTRLTRTESSFGTVPLSSRTFVLSRWCDKALGFVSREGDNASTTAWNSPVLTPAGVVGAYSLTPYSRKFGAFNPATGDALFAQPQPVRYL